MAGYYFRKCKYCGKNIKIQRSPSGKWMSYEANADGVYSEPHYHDYETDRNRPRFFNLGSILMVIGLSSLAILLIFILGKDTFLPEPIQNFITTLGWWFYILPFLLLIIGIVFRVLSASELLFISICSFLAAVLLTWLITNLIINISLSGKDLLDSFIARVQNPHLGSLRLISFDGRFFFDRYIKTSKSRSKQPIKRRKASYDIENQDNLYAEAVATVRQANRASTSLLQRKLRIGYTRAAFLIDTMEQEGLIKKSPSSQYLYDIVT